MMAWAGREGHLWIVSEVVVVGAVIIVGFDLKFWFCRQKWNFNFFHVAQHLEWPRQNSNHDNVSTVNRRFPASPNFRISILVH